MGELLHDELRSLARGVDDQWVAIEAVQHYGILRAQIVNLNKFELFANRNEILRE